jgi:fatty-acyl-CoA synthase/long-chain acyl-CoA synthetase
MPDLLATYAQLHPDRTAVVDDRPDGSIITRSWAEMDAESNQLAHVLLAHGASPGAKVVWCGENSIGVVRVVGAARKAGVTAVPLNYRLADDEAAYVVDHCDAVVACVDAASAPMFERIRDRIPQVRAVLVYDGVPPEGMASAEALMAAASTEPPDLPPSSSTGATMIYTSGTTGKPKGAFRPNGTDPEITAAMIRHIGYQPDDVYLTTGPLYHSGPGGFMVIAQSLGGTVVIQRKFDAEDWLRLVDKYAVTTTFSAPTPIRKVCTLPEEVKQRYDRSSMRRMVANAAPWSMALKRLYLADFPHDSLWEVYGSTELGVDCILEPEDQLRKPGSCGRPAPMVEIALFDDDGQRVTATGPDHPGELFVRGRSVFGDYYKQHDRYLADHREGWQTVGDVAYRDDEGYYYICDRKKDMVISGGMNIYPAEVEAALELHPDVFEAAVFGIPSEEWGELVHAAVVLRPGADVDAAGIQDFAREKLASYKIPRSVSFLDELPKTGSGKILKRDLRAPYWADRATSVG